jgi:hypothetical protein
MKLFMGQAEVTVVDINNVVYKVLVCKPKYVNEDTIILKCS